jgi:hypothetical protein
MGGRVNGFMSGQWFGKSAASLDGTPGKGKSKIGFGKLDYHGLKAEP